MNYRLLLMDMDSTLINEEGIDLLAQLSGVGDAVSALTEAAMAGQKDFYSSLKERCALLQGQRIERFKEVRDSLSLTEGAKDLISELKERNWRIGVVSGGFHEIIDEFLAPLELDFLRANRFESVSGLLTGKVLDPIIGPSEKAVALSQFAGQYGIPLEETVSIGDGANDREMILAAGIGIAFCAKKALKEVADVSIDERDLRLVLNHL